MSPDLILPALLAVVLVPWAAWRLLRRQAARRRRQRARLLAAARQETNPSRRRRLMLQWNDLGGTVKIKRTVRRDTIRQIGQQARGKGVPLSANPYRNRLWGPGRLWKAGWKSVDRQVRWLEDHRVGSP